MMLPFPTPTQATMIITKFMVRQRRHHWQELEPEDPQLECLDFSNV